MPDAPKQSLPDEVGLTTAGNAAVALYGVPMTPERRDAVVFSFAAVATATRLVAALPLDDGAGVLRVSGASPEPTEAGATAATSAVVGQQTLVLGGVSLPLQPEPGVFTRLPSFVGLPVAAVPLRLDNGLPLGVQVIAVSWREGLALHVAKALEAGSIASIPGVRS